MSTKKSPSSRNCVSVAALPLIQALLLPFVSITRRTKMPASLSKPAPSSQARLAGVASNSMAISAWLAPSYTTSTSARWPSASCSASIRMDLPAPVSPVSAVNCGGRSSSSAGTMTKFFRLMRRRAIFFNCVRSSAACGAGCRNNSSHAGATCGQIFARAESKCGRPAASV